MRFLKLFLICVLINVLYVVVQNFISKAIIFKVNLLVTIVPTFMYFFAFLIMFLFDFFLKYCGYNNQKSFFFSFMIALFAWIAFFYFVVGKDTLSSIFINQFILIFIIVNIFIIKMRLYK